MDRLSTTNRCRGGVAALVLLATVPAVYLAATSNSWSARSFRENRSDALVLRCAAEMLAGGESPYEREALRQHVCETRLAGSAPPYDLPFAYPPNGLPLFVLTLTGSPWFGHVLFVGVGTVLALLAFYALSGRFCRDPADRVFGLLTAGVCGSLLFNAELGQTGSYVAAAVFAYVLWYHRSPLLAGVALGLLAFKPQYALPLGIVAVMDRRWRLVAAAGITCVACAVVSGALFGFGRWPEFLTAMQGFNVTLPYMTNWFGLMHQALPGYQTAVHEAGLPVMLLATLGIALSGRLFARDSAGTDAWLAFAIAASTFFSPNTHPYDLTILLVPVCLIASRVPRVPVWGAILAFGFAVRLVMYAEQRWLLPVLTIGLLAGVLVVPRFGRGSRARAPAPA